MRVPISIAAAITFFSGMAGAQAVTPIQQLSVPNLDPNFGTSVDVIADITGDGISDLVVGSPSLEFGIGAAYVFSGADGSVVHTLYTPTALDPGFGFSVADAGDVDGDGVTDIIGGAPGYFGFGQFPAPGVVAVYSGADSSLIHALGDGTDSAFGWSVEGLGDVNADGHADFAVGSLLYPALTIENGRVTVYSGATGLPLYSVDGTFPGERLGASLSSIEDMNGDGVAELIIGASGGEYVQVRSGATGDVMLTVVGPPTLSASDFGWSVDATEDLDGDGLQDVIIGAPLTQIGLEQRVGRATVHSSATGALLHSFQGLIENDHFGWSVSGAGDFNFDGSPDLLVGSTMRDSQSFFPPGIVYAFSGLDGSTLHTVFGPGTGSLFGASVEFAGDTTGDGFLEFIAGAPNNRVADHIQLEPGNLGTNYCANTPNSTGTPADISGFGSTSVAQNTFTLFAAPLPSTAFAQFYYGPVQVQFPFGDGFRCVGPGILPLSRLPLGSSTSSGVFTTRVDFTLPPNIQGQIFPGTTSNFQAIYRDVPAGGAGFNLTDGLEVTFTP